MPKMEDRHPKKEIGQKLMLMLMLTLTLTLTYHVMIVSQFWNVNSPPTHPIRRNCLYKKYFFVKNCGILIIKIKIMKILFVKNN
jgi:hypothetical protein